MFLISTRNFPPDIGGIQSLMEGLSLGLLNHGPVQVYADDYENSEKYDRNSNLKIERVKGFKIFRKYRKANLIGDFIKNNKVRAIFFDHWKSIEKIDADILKETKSFCLIHSKEINHSIGTNLNKRMIYSLNKANYVIANSNFTKNLAIKFGLDNSKISIIHPGCKLPIEIKDEYIKKARETYNNSFPKLITIARLDGRKSHANILMTIKNLLPKFPKLKYVSIGDGDQKNNLEKLKKELGLDEVVKFIYKSEEQTKVALLQQSDLLVMPSVIFKKSIEGFGITFIEAASYGKASLGGIFGGESDAIIEGQTGYLCDGNNLNSIYETIIKSFDNDNYKKLGKNALVFSKEFTWDKITKKYLDLI